MNRRNFLQIAGTGLLAAPGIVRSGVLMPVKEITDPSYIISYQAWWREGTRLACSICNTKITNIDPKSIKPVRPYLYGQHLIREEWTIYDSKGSPILASNSDIGG